MTIPADWWERPYRPEGPKPRAKEVRAAVREAARDRAKCPKHHRTAANAAALDVRQRLAPWADEHRVTTAWPNPRATWGDSFHAMCWVRRGGGAAHVAAEVQAPTLAGALDALTAALRALLAKGAPIENRWAGYDEHAEKIYPGMPQEEFERIYEAIAGHPWRERGGASMTPAVSGGDLAALGLRSVPTAQELQVAWRASARRHHPDAGGRVEDFTRARAAYERLQKAVA